MRAKADSANIDLLISGSRKSTEIFRGAFWYDGEILESGTPRNDLLFKDSLATRDKVYSRYSIHKDKKTVLYAPTFRANSDISSYIDDFTQIKQALHALMGGNWEVLVRTHPNVKADYQPNSAIDVTGYSDMQELLAAVDVLITDYSSCMFDFAVAGKPCFLYTPDLQNYLQKERGLYFDFEELPFPASMSLQDLCACVKAFDSGQYKAAAEDFTQRVGSFEDGNAAVRVVEYIKQKAIEVSK
jgi:CDP-glycerol glycerophosphotransferase